jgi:uncharacterized protein YceK
MNKIMAVCAAAIALRGRASIGRRTDSRFGPRICPGVRADGWEMTHKDEADHAFLYWMVFVDLPLSAIADTALLPLGLANSSCHSDSITNNSQTNSN